MRGLSLVLAALGFYIKSKVSIEENRETQLYLKKLVRQVNEANLPWKGKYNPFGTRTKNYNYPIEKNVSGIQQSVEDLKKFFVSEKMQQHLRDIENFPTESLPAYFDARERWSNCPSISEVYNQGGCGSCYAVAAAGVAADRACIHSNGSFNSLFSEEDILGCCAICGNCYGGDPLKAFVYWVHEGLVTGGRDGCRPYSVNIECGVPCSPAEYPFNEYRRKCTRRCQSIYFQNSYEDDKHYASIAYSLFPRTMSLDKQGKNRLKIPTVIGHFNETQGPLSNEQIRSIIMKELYLSGPTTMAFPVTEEFLHYASGVFSPYPVDNFNKRIVYWHVVRLIGWGRYDDNKHYWLAVNSFGRHWGDNGVFKIDTSLVEDFGLEYETGLP
uniref:Pept_C1 domain-containing protein n=1 Tax=Syphacia muris TaxID=451379 RepID=A0A0N5A8X0_9BILA